VGTPWVGHDSSTQRSFGPGEYAPTDEAITTAPTPVAAAARSSAAVPSTLVCHIDLSSRAGWIAQAR
jgi:hypothetical protein